MNQKLLSSLSLVSVCLLALGYAAEAQFFDRMFYRQEGAEAPSQAPGVRRDKNGLGVNIPIFYDMRKNGDDLGINVLQGLVKVERGNEAVRSGLHGPRPLSVRVFGIPVYERGVRVSPSEGSLGESLPEPDHEPERPVKPVEIPNGPDGPVDP